MRKLFRVLLVVALAALIALAIGVAYTQLQTRRAEAAYPPAGKFITAGIASLHYTIGGEGNPVVLIHGNPGSTQDWAPLLPLLAPRYRYVALDRPGHGYSTRPPAQVLSPSGQVATIRQALRNIGITKPILVGHSWGAALALIYALEYPDDVTGLVLIGPRAFLLPERSAQIHFALRRDHGSDSHHRRRARRADARGCPAIAPHPPCGVARGASDRALRPANRTAGGDDGHRAGGRARHGSVIDASPTGPHRR